MFRAGDEFLQTQGGNNNAYNQDNETSWLDWSRLETHAEVFAFFKKMIAFRKAHPTLCRSRYWREDIVWHGVEKEPDLSQESRSLAFYLNGSSQGDDDLYVMINSYWEPLTFRIQHGKADEWRRVIDTAGDVDDTVPYLNCTVDARSIVVLVRVS